MAEEDHKSILSLPTRLYARAVDKIKENRNSGSVKDPETFNKTLREMIAEAVDEARRTEKSGEEMLESLKTVSGSDRSWRQKKTQLQNSFNIFYRDRNTLLDEKSQIAEMENATHRRNIFYRAITTLVVGFCILFVYGVAHRLEIPLPLIRIP